MRHRNAHRKLSRNSSHRRSMLRNLVTDFLDHGRLMTTLPKAKEVRPLAEKMITLGKRDNLHARRQLQALAAHHLIPLISPALVMNGDRAVRVKGQNFGGPPVALPMDVNRVAGQ